MTNEIKVKNVWKGHTYTGEIVFELEIVNGTTDWRRAIDLIRHEVDLFEENLEWSAYEGKI